MTTNLSKMKKGQSGVILEIEIKKIDKKRHLLEMGLTQGTKIKLKKIAPTGGTICIELRGYELCIGKEDAEKIKVLV